MIALEPGEKILYVARKHWFIFVSEIFFILLLALAPIVLYFFAGNFFASYIEEPLSQLILLEGNRYAIVSFFYALWLLVLWHVLAYFWTDYYLDVLIVTDERLLDVEQLGLFNRKISGFRHDSIQDVTIEIPGILATFLKYGTISIRTAGKDEAFQFPGVGYPHKLKELIVSEHNKARDRVPGTMIAQ